MQAQSAELLRAAPKFGTSEDANETCQAMASWMRNAHPISTRVQADAQELDLGDLKINSPDRGSAEETFDVAEAHAGLVTDLWHVYTPAGVTTDWTAKLAPTLTGSFPNTDYTVSLLFQKDPRQLVALSDPCQFQFWISSLSISMHEGQLSLQGKIDQEHEAPAGTDVPDSCKPYIAALRALPQGVPMGYLTNLCRGGVCGYTELALRWSTTSPDLEFFAMPQN
jgi:hypothetical protein